MQPEPIDAPVETPLEDAQEQAEPAVPGDVEDEQSPDEIADVAERRGLEVGEWDASEQARPVSLDDEDR